MKKRSIVGIGILLVLILSTISGCTGSIGWATEALDGAYNADANTVLEVNNINGNVDVEVWDGVKVDLHAVKKVKEDKKDDLDDVEIVVTELNNTIRIETVHSRQDLDVSVTMTIKVPAVVTVVLVQTVNGNIDVEDTKGNLTVSSTNGNIEIDDIEGYVTVQNTNGNIDIDDVTGIGNVITTNGMIKTEVEDVIGNINIRTTNGGITAYIRSSLDADLDIKTTNGDINLHDLTLDLTTNEDKHKVGTLGSGGDDIDIQTSNGNIDVYKK